jgi:hypothetical protein
MNGPVSLAEKEAPHLQAHKHFFRTIILPPKGFMHAPRGIKTGSAWY